MKNFDDFAAIIKADKSYIADYEKAITDLADENGIVDQNKLLGALTAQNLATTLKLFRAYHEWTESTSE